MNLGGALLKDGGPQGGVMVTHNLELALRAGRRLRMKNGLIAEVR